MSIHNVGIIASRRVIGTPTTKYVIELTGSGTWTVPPGVTKIDHLFMVGGGGGGGRRAGGGGGAGELRHIFDHMVTPGSSLSYVVGSGGAAASVSDSVGVKGDDTSFNGIVALGGGYGGCRSTATDQSNIPSTGGSGGGGGGASRSDTRISAPGTGSNTHSGGEGNYSSVSNNRGGGGGGAQSVGGAASTSNGGNGGAGLNVGATYPDLAAYGVSGVFAGGGGGGANTGTAGSGGSGGGGVGGASGPAGNGVAKTGSGGGGGGISSQSAGAGGSGTIVLIYYGP